jgi:hypothetical protein
VTLTSRTREYESYSQALEDYYEQGWTDGLPIVPPTAEAVGAMLDAAGLEGPEILGDIPTRNVTVIAEKTAVNAVMAGCLPRYFPVVVGAVRALLQPKANAHSTTATLAGAAHAVIVNGPVRSEVGIEGGQACLGPGFRANATIGRAVRLVIRNVFRAVPGVLDRATFSWPLRYSLCFAEDEEFSNWTPLHVHLGYRSDESVVTVQSVLRMLQATSTAPEGEEILARIARTARIDGLARDDFIGDDRGVVVVVGQEHYRRLDDQGWTKESVRDRLWELMAAPAGDDERMVVLAQPANVLVVMAGGPGLAQSMLLIPHLSAPTHERIPS